VKIIILIASIVVAVIVAALFGVLHDQVTFSIAPEYYTLLKFRQFDVAPLPGAPEYAMRWAVALVGVYATWWVGLFLGTVLGLLGLTQRSAASMARVMQVSLSIVVVSAIGFAVLGYALWPQFRALELIAAVPLAVQDPDAFTRVGVIHSFSYLGGAAGALIAIVYAVVFRSRDKV
jgi:hypothetical protein